ncbi:Crp/Fnr family transcriptional regulator [Hymenobacter ginsengisoli]|uniref:Crp/Fnr family transcriptional regulator n=1 Tax=Hymenobacter ginsengisoli TaxID=1051626 RepID=A0ABP8QHC2_9BACT|nr:MULTISPECIES: Crp/Fnr family transcriptional regulator [unclassified Hymenobacter]MBO2029913.1 Crp/Fnr family transcriptional regulator [Hymenobacter sp. BT559]
MLRQATPDCHDCPSRQHNLLSCCPAADIDAIAQDKYSQHYRAGQPIFSEGTRPAGLYCVHEGRVKITKSGGDGKEQIIRLVRPGDVLGYRALVAGSVHATSAIALTDCIVCLISKSVIAHQIEANAHFSGALLQLLAANLGDVAERMLHLAYKPVRERLAEALLLLLRTYHPAEAAGQPFTIAISREDLGALMGTTKETTTRMLSEFRHEGLLATRGSAITILAPRQLGQIAALFD